MLLQPIYPGAPAILRGTVRAAKGAIKGTGLNQAARQANLATLQAAINAAASQKKFFELEPGDYQIEGAAGLVIPTGKGHFDWRGTKGSHIKQFTDNAPVLTIGDIATSNTTENIRLNGFRLSYANDQAGNTAANALYIGLLRNSVVENFDVYADYLVGGPDKRAYRGVYIKNAANSFGFFSNSLRDFQIAGAVLSLFDMALVATGSIFQNGYMTQGVTGARAALTGPALKVLGGADQYESVFENCNVEWVIGDGVPVIQLQSCRQLSLIGLHVEGCTIQGFNPHLFEINSSQVNIIGLNVLDLAAPSSGASGAEGQIFTLYGNANDDCYVSGNCQISWSAASQMLRNTHVIGPNAFTDAASILHNYLDVIVRDVGANNAAFLFHDTVQAPNRVLSLTTAAANGTLSIPSGWAVEGISYENTTANAVTGGVKIGTTSGATDVVAAQAVSANQSSFIAEANILKRHFSTTGQATSAQTLFIQPVTSWNSASVKWRVAIRKVF